MAVHLIMIKFQGLQKIMKKLALVKLKMRKNV